jgi:phosphohistidine phosphatase
LEKSGESATKQLILMRHAKSDWGTESVSDHERPLNKRGRHGADLMAQWFISKLDIPDKILCSSARRTQETVQRLAAFWDRHPDTHLIPELYLAPPEQIIRQVNLHGGASRRLLVVAHNPGLENLSSHFLGRLTPFPTAAVAVFSAPNELAWADLQMDSKLSLEQWVRPKELD